MKLNFDLPCTEKPFWSGLTILLKGQEPDSGLSEATLPPFKCKLFMHY